MHAHNVTTPSLLRIACLVCAVALAGCVSDGGSPVGVNTTQQYPASEPLTLGANYQALAQCWRTETARQPGRVGNRAQVRIDEGQSFAEIALPRGNANAARIQLRALGPRRTTVNTYATSQAGEATIREWIEVLKACQNTMSGTS